MYWGDSQSSTPFDNPYCWFATVQCWILSESPHYLKSFAVSPVSWSFTRLVPKFCRCLQLIICKRDKYRKPAAILLQSTRLLLLNNLHTCCQSYQVFLAGDFVFRQNSRFAVKRETLRHCLRIFIEGTSHVTCLFAQVIVKLSNKLKACGVKRTDGHEEQI